MFNEVISWEDPQSPEAPALGVLLLPEVEDNIQSPSFHQCTIKTYRVYMQNCKLNLSHMFSGFGAQLYMRGRTPLDVATAWTLLSWAQPSPLIGILWSREDGELTQVGEKHDQTQVRVWD